MYNSFEYERNMVIQTLWLAYSYSVNKVTTANQNRVLRPSLQHGHVLQWYTNTTIKNQLYKNCIKVTWLIMQFKNKSHLIYSVV